MSKCIGECLACGATFEQNLKLCPKCNSKNIRNTLTLIDEIKIHEGTKRKEGKGKQSKESLDETKIGGDGREAKQSRIVDRVNNHDFQDVKVKNEKGEWVDFHHDDEPLTEHNKKLQKKQNDS